MSTKQKRPRGLRNNNPLNLRIGNNWLGEVVNPTDHEFEQFQTLFYGCRATFIVFRNYIRRHKCDTLRKFISRWAPNSENNTRAYIMHVSRTMDIAPDAKVLRFEDKEQMIRLFNAMCEVECGEIPCSPNEVKDISLAYDASLTR